MKRNALIVLFLLLNCIVYSGAREYYPTTIVGKSGKELKIALQNHVANHIRVGDNIWEVFRKSDCRDDGNVWSMYTHDNIAFINDGVSASVGMDIDRLIHCNWYGDKFPYQQDLSFDLHQITPCPYDVGYHKNEYPVGAVYESTYDNGVWKVGYSMMLGTKINAFEPADEYKGDFARMIMYIVTCYADYSWQSFAPNLFSGGLYPTLNSYAQEFLLRWHRNDPVSKKETVRNDAIYKVQNNRNPFVDYPELAEHIWGVKKDIGFSFGNDIPEVEIAPLRAIYHITDVRIDLYSPYIPYGVSWLINGISVADKYLVPAKIGIGTHELQYLGNGVKGKVKIKIVP